MLGLVLAQLEAAATLICCVFAILKGGTGDRIGATLILVFYAADDLAFITLGRGFPTTEIFLGDFVLALGLLILAVRYSSLWLGCAMLLQSANLCSQGLALGGDGLGIQEQLWLNNGLSTLMKACVVTGAASSWRRRLKSRRTQTEPSASSRLSPSLT